MEVACHPSKSQTINIVNTTPWTHQQLILFQEILSVIRVSALGLHITNLSSYISITPISKCKHGFHPLVGLHSTYDQIKKDNYANFPTYILLYPSKLRSGQ